MKMPFLTLPIDFGCQFVRVGTDDVVHVDQVATLDCTELESFRVAVTLRDGRRFELRDQQALDLVMAIKPSALEGRRFRWARGAWAFHNLVAHPVLQVLASLGYTRLGMRIHDWTVPRPRGRR